MAMPTVEVADPELVELVGEWLTVPDLAARTGTDVSGVRRMLTDGELLALRVDGVLRVPALFLVAGTASVAERRGERDARSAAEPGDPANPIPLVALPDLRGTLTVLADSGFRPSEAVAWLFTSDDTLVGGRPVDALRLGRKTEVRRRAQAMAL